jgi:hypothetical protein
MSFDKFIQTRTIAKKQIIAPNQAVFPTYTLSSYIDFETDGFLVGLHFMITHQVDNPGATSLNFVDPAGAIVAKVSGDLLSLPAGGDVTNYSGAQILVSSLSHPGSNSDTDFNQSSRQTTIAYDADSKRIPIRSNDRLGVYLCGNGNDSSLNFAYTLTAYFVRS